MRRNHNRGTYNLTKTKILTYLADMKDGGDRGPIGLAALVKATGTNYNYLKTRLRVWSAWGYLHCHTLTPDKGRPYYGYSLAAAGRGYIKNLSKPYRVKGYPKAVSLADEPYPMAGLDSIDRPGDWLKGIGRDSRSFLASADGGDSDDDIEATELEIAEDDI